MEIPPSAIPIVDILKINSTLSVKENERDWIEIGAQIDAALHSTGFVYLKNTGIPQEIVSFIRVNNVGNQSILVY